MITATFSLEWSYLFFQFTEQKRAKRLGFFGKFKVNANVTLLMLNFLG